GPGRPPIGSELKHLSENIARPNPLWGAPRIHGKLLKLGFTNSQRSGARLVLRRRGPPSRSWQTSLGNHAAHLVAVAFLGVPTAPCPILFGFGALLAACKRCSAGQADLPDPPRRPRRSRRGPREPTSRRQAYLPQGSSYPIGCRRHKCTRAMLPIECTS